MSEDLFDSSAGDISLEFANTNDWHASDHPVEYLHDYHDLVAWAKKASLITDEMAGQLAKIADEQPENAKRAYHYAIEIREAIYRIFAHSYAGKPIPKTDLDELNALVSIAKAHQQIVPIDGKFQWDWKSDHDGTNIIVWRVALAAAELLTSDRIARVRQCEDDRGCGFLFIDVSKNHSRRWCSMESCGNRAKARRHYSRRKKE